MTGVRPVYEGRINYKKARRPPPMEMELRALAVQRPRHGIIHKLSAQKPTSLGIAGEKLLDNFSYFSILEPTLQDINPTCLQATT